MHEAPGGELSVDDLLQQNSAEQDLRQDGDQDDEGRADPETGKDHQRHGPHQLDGQEGTFFLGLCGV